MPLPRRTLRATALAAGLLMLSTAPGAQNVFTGNRPVYLGSWFNGSFTEVQEFQFALDWQGWCNARAGANCQAIAFMAQPLNWSDGTVPNANSTVQVPQGRTARLGDFNSAFQGFLTGPGAIGDLSVGGRFESSSFLQVGGASINDYFAFVGGQLDTTGMTQIQLLSSPQAAFSGSGGTTLINGWSSNSLSIGLGTGHRLQLVGGGQAQAEPLNGSRRLEVRMAPSAVAENLGQLVLNNSAFRLQGTAGPQTLPTFNNLGSISGTVLMDGTRFNNQGQVQVGAGEVFGLGLLGRHTGSFVGALGSSMVFGGFVGPGVVFEASSSMNTEGLVTAQRGSHRVLGSWQSRDLELVGNSAGMRFEGPAPTLQTLKLQGDFVRAAFASPAGTAQIGAVTIENGTLAAELGNVRANSLLLRRGAVEVEASLLNTGGLDWYGGRLSGTGTLTQQGAVRLLADAAPRVMNMTLVRQQGDLSWEGGSFSAWSGEWRVASGRRFDLQGDFNASGSGGLLHLDGAELLKSAGSGRAELGVRVLNKGTVKVDSGVLALTGGSVHDFGGRLNAAAGARIELGGDTTLYAGLQQSGRIDVVGGTLRLMDGLNFVSSTPNSLFNPTNLVVSRNAGLNRTGAVSLGGTLDNAGSVQISGAFETGGNVRNESLLRVGGALTVRGVLANTGALDVGSSLFVDGNFVQAGTLTRPTTGGITVVGDFDSRAPLRMDDASLQVTGSVRLGAATTLTGNIGGFATHLDNFDTLSFIGSGGSVFSVWETVTNRGTIRLDGAAQGFSHGGLLSNHGQIHSEGTWYSNDLLMLAGSRFDNLGIVNHSGVAVLASGSRLAGSGHFENQGGVVQIDAGASLQTGQLYRQWGDSTAMTRVNGRLEAPAGIEINGGALRGTGVLVGDVSIGTSAIWAPGNSPGTQSVQGSVALNGVLEIEVASLTVHDRLRLSGDFSTGSDAILRFQIAPGFQAQDGDTLEWVLANSVSTVYGSLEVQAPAGFDATLATDGRLLFTDLSATRLPASGNVVVDAGTVRFNDRPDPFDPLLLDAVTVNGTLSNRKDAYLGLNADLQVNPGGSFLQRGSLEASGSLTRNEGHWRGGPGSRSAFYQLENAGRFDSEGDDRVWLLTNKAGATQRVDGSLEVLSAWTNQGSLRIGGTARDEGFRFNNSGPLTVEVGGVLAVKQFIQGWGPDGALLRVDGRLEAPQGVQVLNGQLQGKGVIAADVEIRSGAQLAPGNSVGRLEITGNLRAEGAEIFLEIDPDGSHDTLAVGGLLDWSFLTVTLAFQLDTPPQLGSFQLVSADRFGGSLCGSCWQIATGTPETGYTFWGQGSPFTDIAIRFDAGGLLTVSAVPEPQTWALFVAGLLAVGAFKRRLTASLPSRHP